MHAHDHDSGRGRARAGTARRRAARVRPVADAGGVRTRQRLACSNVEFIGVRGSGESYRGNYGMGNQIGALYEQVKARKPGAQTLQSYGLEYQAVNVAEWWKAWDYFFSVWEGDEHLESRIKADASSCPSMKILVGGFSQGAHVVGDTIENLANKNDSSLSHVYGVALYGDPRFNPGRQSHGAGQLQPRTLGHPDRARRVLLESQQPPR